MREVRSALHRRKREERYARRAVAEQMHSEMSETLTAMLLSCELAMSVPDIPHPAVEKIRTIDHPRAKASAASGSELTVLFSLKCRGRGWSARRPPRVSGFSGLVVLGEAVARAFGAFVPSSSSSSKFLETIR